MCLYFKSPYYNLPIYVGDNNHYGYYQPYPKEIPTSVKSEPCRCCNGTGIQLNKDKVWIRCPGCKGTGTW
jgi:hypothetical protein